MFGVYKTYEEFVAASVEKCKEATFQSTPNTCECRQCWQRYANFYASTRWAGSGKGHTHAIHL